jgi:hypothetical protein
MLGQKYMTNIKTSQIIFAIITPVLIVLFCWKLIDGYSSSAVCNVNGISQENRNLKEIEVAGQFGDKFGFVTSVFTGLSFSFLLLILY